MNQDDARRRPYPPTDRRLEREVLHGRVFEDSYVWLEDSDSHETRAWTHAQAQFARSVLDALPERDALSRDVAALRVNPDVWSNLHRDGGVVQRAGNRCFYVLRRADRNAPTLMMREGDDEPVTLIDVEHLPPSVERPPPVNLDWFAPSHDGRRLAVGLSSSGSEDSTLFVFDVDTRAWHDLAIEHVRYDNGGDRGSVSWLPDHTSFVYRRVRDGERSAVFRHVLGEPPEGDAAVWGHDGPHGVVLTEDDDPWLAVMPESDVAIAFGVRGDSKELALFVAPTHTLSNAPGAVPWRQITSYDDNVEGYAAHGTTVFVRSTKNAPRGRILALDAAHDTFGTAREVVPPSERVVLGMLTVGDTLLVCDLDGGINRLRRVEPDGATCPSPSTGTSICSTAGTAPPSRAARPRATCCSNCSLGRCRRACTASTFTTTP